MSASNQFNAFCHTGPFRAASYSRHHTGHSEKTYTLLRGAIDRKGQTLRHIYLTTKGYLEAWLIFLKSTTIQTWSENDWHGQYNINLIKISAYINLQPYTSKHSVSQSYHFNTSHLYRISYTNMRNALSLTVISLPIHRICTGSHTHT